MTDAAATATSSAANGAMNHSTESGTMFKLPAARAASVFPGFSRITEGHATVFFAPPKQQHNSSDKNDNDNAAAAAAAQATALSSAGEDDATKGDISVFYNPPQVVNRDLSVCVLQTFANERSSDPPRKGGTGNNGLVVLEALSASGLRTVRFWHEVKGLRTIIANDLDADAVECIRRNVDANGIRVVKGADLCAAETILRQCRSRQFFATPEETERQRQAAVAMSSGVVANRDDAIVLMQRAGWDPNLYPPGNFFVQHNQKSKNNIAAGSATASAPPPPLEPLLHSILFDCIDLDPYGTVGPFLDATMDAAKEGALISATSTDSAVLCGNFPETALAKYGSSGIKGDACHEMAPRIVLAALERAANRRGKYIEPLLSLHIDFYVRVFVRVYTQPAEVKLAMCKLGLQVQCSCCPQYHIQPLGTVPVPRSGRRAGGGNQNKKNNEMKEMKGKKRAAANETAENSTNRDDDDNDGGGENNTVTTAATAAAASGKNSSSHATNTVAFPPVPDRGQGAQHNFHHNAFSDFAPESSARCVCCGGRLLIGGPLYCAPMHSQPFIERLLAEIERRGNAGEIAAFARVRGLVVTARDELPDVPLFSKLPSIASDLKMCCPPAQDIHRALDRLGYRYSSVHGESVGFKTDAPMKVLIGVLLQHKAVFGPDASGRDEAMQKMVEEKKKKNAAAAATAVPPVCSDEALAALVPDKFRGFVAPVAAADFTPYTEEEQTELKRSRAAGEKKVARFVLNAPGWGPRARHTGAAMTTAAGATDAAVRRDRECEE